MSVQRNKRTSKGIPRHLGLIQADGLGLQAASSLLGKKYLISHKNGFQQNQSYDYLLKPQ